MADDYEDIYDIESMTDEEIQALVREEVDGHPELDGSGLDFVVADGLVTISGRVGTEAESQSLERMLTDGIGVTVRNDVVVDDLVRAEQPEGADAAAALRFRTGQGHGGADRTEDSAEHLLEDTAAEQYGTDDMGEAIERGYTYNPPDS